jgi:hypothetical protein
MFSPLAPFNIKINNSSSSKSSEEATTAIALTTALMAVRNGNGIDFMQINQKFHFIIHSL